MKHIKLFESFINENWDGKSREVKLGGFVAGKVGKFDLIYQISSKTMKGNGISGTIRTTPQNYYVATIDDKGKISFDNLETMTKDINKSEVEKLFNDYKLNFGLSEDKKRFTRIWGDDGAENYRWKKQENKDFLFKLVNRVLSLEKNEGANPNGYVSEIRPDRQNFILDIANDLLLME